ncbi:MAG: PEP-CTERM sorting domain-containing protein [Gemmataceae bacterium]
MKYLRHAALMAAFGVALAGASTARALVPPHSPTGVSSGEIPPDQPPTVPTPPATPPTIPDLPPDMFTPPPVATPPATPCTCPPPVHTQSTPEPTTVVSLLTGLGVLGGYALRRRKK